MNSRQEKKVKMFSHLSPRQKGEQNKCQIYSRQEISSSKKSSDSSGTTSLRSMKMSQRSFRLKQTHGQTMCETGVSHQQIVRVTFIHKFKDFWKITLQWNQSKRELELSSVDISSVNRSFSHHNFFCN